MLTAHRAFVWPKETPPFDGWMSALSQSVTVYLSLLQRDAQRRASILPDLTRLTATRWERCTRKEGCFWWYGAKVCPYTYILFFFHFLWALRLKALWPGCFDPIVSFFVSRFASAYDLGFRIRVLNILFFFFFTCFFLRLYFSLSDWGQEIDLALFLHQYQTSFASKATRVIETHFILLGIHRQSVVVTWN